MYPSQYAEKLVTRTPHCGDVYEESAFSLIFIEYLDPFVRQNMRYHEIFLNDATLIASQSMRNHYQFNKSEAYCPKLRHQYLASWLQRDNRSHKKVSVAEPEDGHAKGGVRNNFRTEDGQKTSSGNTSNGGRIKLNRYRCSILPNRKHGLVLLD